MRAYERLLNYIKYPTASSEESETCPSTSSQTVLAMALADEMKEIGISNVTVDDNSYVYGEIPASEGFETCTKIGFISHMDVSDSCSSINIKPQIIDYNGGDILLNEEPGISITVKDYPEIEDFKGKHLITTDGTTLLGADDKCGIAEILTAAEQILADKERKHGKISICFTPDEEIGRGPDKFDMDRFGAEYAYTVDGAEFGAVEYTTFNAASAKVSFKGVRAHLGSAKNIMINSYLVAMEFNSYLPRLEIPEKTDNYQGYYCLYNVSGTVSDCELSYVIRDFDKDNIKTRVNNLYLIADEINKNYGKEICTVESRYEYRNMEEVIAQHFHLVENARKAIELAGGTPFSKPVRGGTDGCELSYKGLPCPNLGTGGNNFHSIYEYCCIEDMDKCVDVIKNIAYIYSNYTI